MERQWEEITKGAIAEEFYSSGWIRPSVILKLFPNVTTIITGHGYIRSYWNRFNLYEIKSVHENTEHKR
jgi:hypothetical protein